MKCCTSRNCYSSVSSDKGTKSSNYWTRPTIGSNTSSSNSLRTYCYDKPIDTTDRSSDSTGKSCWEEYLIWCVSVTDTDSSTVGRAIRLVRPYLSSRSPKEKICISRPDKMLCILVYTVKAAGIGIQNSINSLVDNSVTSYSGTESSGTRISGS